jgi:sulfur-carrier protein
MEVKVLFFGVLEEVTGFNLKIYSEVRSLADLRHRIEDDFPEIVHYNYMTSLNNEIISGDGQLKNGDEIALMPPFAGG